MQKSKLAEALRTLNAKELILFRDFVHSPFFNKNENLKTLIDCLLPAAPLFGDGLLAKRKVFIKVFGKNEPYNELKINNLSSDLLKTWYNFLAQKSFIENRPLQRNNQIEELFKKGLDKHIEQVLKRFQKTGAKEPAQRLSGFLNDFHLHELLDELQSKKQKRQFSTHLQTANDQLDLFYFLTKLKMACQMENRNMLLNANHECHFIEDILQMLAADLPYLANEPLVKVYSAALSMLRSYPLGAAAQDDRFYFFKNALLEHSKRLEFNDLYILSHYLLNFCIKKINSGQGHFYQEVLELYKVMLEEKVIVKNEQITQYTFRNVTTAGIRLEEFEWTERFIDDYREHLPDVEREAAVAYNLALLYYAKRDFSSALQSLQNVEFSDYLYFLSARIIQLQCYFELNEEKAFSALITATQKYLRRNRKVSGYHKRSNGNFLRLAKKLFQLRHNKAYLNNRQFRQKLDGLKMELNILVPLVNKEWLQEGVRGLEEGG